MTSPIMRHRSMILRRPMELLATPHNVLRHPSGSHGVIRPLTSMDSPEDYFMYALNGPRPGFLFDKGHAALVHSARLIARISSLLEAG